MKFLTSLSLLLISTLSPLWAQDCLGITFKPGMHMELTLYSTKDQPTGTIVYQINNVRKEGSSTVIDLTAQFADEKGNRREPSAVRYTCTGDELVAGLSGMGSAFANSGTKQEVRLKTNQLIYPTKLGVGQKLADGLMEAEMYTDGVPMAQMNITVNNRQVEGKETLTTPAGTFDTYKITADMRYETRVMGIPIRNKMRFVSYRANNVLFDVKSENYDKNGKLMSYTVLSKAN